MQEEKRRKTGTKGEPAQPPPSMQDTRHTDGEDEPRRSTNAAQIPNAAHRWRGTRSRAFLRNFYECAEDHAAERRGKAKPMRQDRRGKRTPNEDGKPPRACSLCTIRAQLYNIDIFLTISNKLERGKMQLHPLIIHIYTYNQHTIKYNI